MSEEQRELAVKFRVGLFVLVALAAFLGMVYALGARARLFEARYTIHADFTEVAGLTEGATVRLAGVQIGRVGGVHLPGQPGGKVRVDLNIARRYAETLHGSSRQAEATDLLQGALDEFLVSNAVEGLEVLAAGAARGITGTPLYRLAHRLKRFRAALANLDKDRAFLKAGDVFTDDMIDSYIELKMEEIIRFDQTPHPVEFDMYYSV